VVAGFLAVSIQDLRPNSQDISAFYLANIYQVFANSNATAPQISPPSTVVLPPPFSPPRYAVWVNSLWVLSLVIALTGALLATSLQQWARRYINFTQPERCKPERRARVRAFFANGVDKLRLPSAVELLPALIHLSLFLFFAGLVIFLFNINHSVFVSVIWWIGLYSITYGWVTLMPIFRHDSPYYTPLSSIAWSLYAAMLYILFSALTSFKTIICARSQNRGSRDMGAQNTGRLQLLSERYADRMLGDVLKEAEEAVSDQSSEIDTGILEWTIGTLDEDTALEKFFEAIPDFLISMSAEGLQRGPSIMLRLMLLKPLDGFLRRTFSSHLVDKSVKFRRLVICKGALDVIGFSDTVLPILHNILDDPWSQVPQSIDAGNTLARWCFDDNEDIAEIARCMIAQILATVRERDHRWIALAVRAFHLPGQIIQNSIYDEDNVLLYILIHYAHGAIGRTPRTLPIPWSLFEINLEHTLPELRNNFCALWNDIVFKAREGAVSSTFIDILRRIRHVYIALHHDTDAAPMMFSALTPDSDHILDNALLYPSCNVASHHPYFTCPSYVVTELEETPRTRAHTPTNLIIPPTRPDTPSLSTPYHSTASDMDDAAPVKVTTGVPPISGTANPNPISTSCGDLAQEVKDSTITTSSTAVASSPIPVLTPGPDNVATSVVFPSPVHPTIAPTQPIAHAPRSTSSSSTTTPLHSPVLSQATIVVSQHTSISSNGSFTKIFLFPESAYLNGSLASPDPISDVRR